MIGQFGRNAFYDSGWFGSWDSHNFLDHGDGLEDLTETEIVAVIYSAVLVERWLWGDIRLWLSSPSSCDIHTLVVAPILPVVCVVASYRSQSADHPLDVGSSVMAEARLDLFPSRFRAEGILVFPCFAS